MWLLCNLTCNIHSREKLAFLYEMCVILYLHVGLFVCSGIHYLREQPTRMDSLSRVDSPLQTRLGF